MPPELQPPELAALVDFSERSRTGDWSLRSALVRYAQPEPRRVSEVLDVVRRIEFALQPHAKTLAKRGPEVWAAVQGDDAPRDELDPVLVGVLRAATGIDALADALASWADDRSRPAPHAAVDEAVAVVTAQLDELGVVREQWQGPPPRGARSRG